MIPFFKKNAFLTIFIIAFVYKAEGQFTSLGSAVGNNCGCVTLTPNVGNSSGAAWYNQQLNLNNSFDLSIEIELGCTDLNGADGMAFVLQRNGLSAIGTTGGNIGYAGGGFNQSIAVLLDTYQNSTEGDPSYDHISINTNGDIFHNTANNLDGPVRIIAGIDNVEDCAKHTLRVVWNATTKNLRAFFDGNLRVQANVDIVNSIFSGNPNVYWGMTAGTGGLSNLQRFCPILKGNVTTNTTNNDICVNQAIQLNASVQSTFTIANYYWSLGDGTTSNSLTPPLHTYTVPGNYLVKFAATNTNGCVSDTVYKTIVVHPKPTASFTVNDTCVGNPITLQSNTTGSITNYMWIIDGQLAASNAVITNSNYTVGTHLVKHLVVGIGGCNSDTAYGSFTVFDKPATPTFTVNNSCVGSSTTLSPNNFNNALQYYWIINNAAPVNSNSITNTFAAGNYTIKLYAKVTNGCTSDTAFGNFSVLLKPVANITINDTCATFPITMQSNAANAAYTQQWLINNVPVASTTSYTSTFAPGNYQVQYIVQNTSLCADTANATFTVFPKPTIPLFTVQNICEGLSTNLVPTSLDLSLQYYWIINNAAPVNSNSISNVFTNGNYSVKLYAKNANGCTSDTAIGNFSVLKKPTASIIINDTCETFPITMQSNSANAAYTQQWLINNLPVASTSSYTNTFAPGNYTVQYIVQNTIACADTANATFIVHKKPNISAAAPTVCLGQPTQFTTTISNLPLALQSYQWLFHDGSTSNLMNPSKLFTASGSFTAKVIATTVNGCKSDTLPTTFVITNAVVNAGNDTLVLRNQPFTLNATGDAGTYLWQPSLPFANPAINNPTGTLSNDQQFVVQLTTAQGCIAKDTIVVKVFDGGRIYVPTAFTPNNDGKNDVLLPTYIGINKLNYFSIYNRWGVKVFETQNLATGWSGTYKTKLQPSGTYIFVVSAVDYLGNKFFKKGTEKNFNSFNF
jgi:gliding motility-associated-like protein